MFKEEPTAEQAPNVVVSYFNTRLAIAPSSRDDRLR